ncbi:MAG: VCBS repeat-containing protein [Planctomycetaceae bacterium]|nr:VCBS repeat-containing protein [Planctomycetaceae bacterium]
MPADQLFAQGSIKFKVQRLTVDANEGVDVADVDQDGKLDVVAGRNWYRAPDFVPHPLRGIEDWNGYVTSNGDFAYDVNGDGWVDVIAGAFLSTEINWFENPKTEGLRLGQMWKKHLMVDSKLTQNEGSMFTDIDGDGKPEFLVNSWNKANPMVAWKLSTEDRTETVTVKKNGKNVEVEKTKNVPSLSKILIGERGNGHGMAIGDINNDGRVDILVGEGWYEQPENYSADKPWIYHADWADWHAAVPCVIVDVNGDGKNDVIWAKGHDYGIYWWEVTGQNADGSLQWKEHEVDKSFSQAHALHLADLDGDGQDELITGKRVYAHNGNDPGGKEPGIVCYYTWDRKTLKFTKHDIDTSGKVGIGLQIRTADLNGDGKLDIAVAGKSGTHVLINLGK